MCCQQLWRHCYTTFTASSYQLHDYLERMLMWSSSQINCARWWRYYFKNGQTNAVAYKASQRWSIMFWNSYIDISSRSRLIFNLHLPIPFSFTQTLVVSFLSPYLTRSYFFFASDCSRLLSSTEYITTITSSKSASFRQASTPCGQALWWRLSLLVSYLKATLLLLCLSRISIVGQTDS